MNELTMTLTGPKKERYIIALLTLHGIKETDLANKIGVTQSFLSHVARGNRKGVKKQGLRVRQAIAEALGKEIDDLWPNKKAT